MNRVPLILAVSLLTLLSGCGPSGSSDSDTAVVERLASSTLEAKAVDQANQVSAVFGELKNTSDEDITITSLESTIAEQTTLHVMDGGQMKEPDGGMTIRAGQSLVLQQGGTHIMLVGLRQSINVGDQMEMTVTYSDLATETIPVVGA